MKRNPILVSGDVTSDAAWPAVVDRAMAEYGRLDVLVNNAAIYREIEAKRPLTEIGVDEWDRVLTVNVRGTWQGIKAVAPVMADGGGGRIVNVSSVVAWTSPPGFAHYVAQKAAVNGLTRAAARELGPAGIRVNAVAPGLVDNEASRALNNDEYLDAAAGARALARPMVPVDIVGAVLWLASESAGFVTGQTIVVDGGQVMLTVDVHPRQPDDSLLVGGFVLSRTEIGLDLADRIIQRPDSLRHFVIVRQPRRGSMILPAMAAPIPSFSDHMRARQLNSS